MDPKPYALAEIVRFVCEESLMFADERSPFQAKAYYPKHQTPVCVIVGENASGKSVFFQVMAGRARQEHALLPVTISIRERTGAGSYEMSGMRRIMMFGDESQQSTGATSYNVIQSGFHNATKPDTPAMLLLDEPEMGLSDGYARALGHYIGREALAAPPSLAGVVVVTHSRPLVDSLCMMAGISPLFVNLNPAPAPLLDWLETDEVRSIDDLKTLREMAIARRHAVANLRNNKEDD
jgi:hypothetical protein